MGRRNLYHLLHDTLRNAGFVEGHAAYHGRLADPSPAEPGYTLKRLYDEPKAYVDHIGKDSKAMLVKYAAALNAAGIPTSLRPRNSLQKKNVLVVEIEMKHSGSWEEKLTAREEQEDLVANLSKRLAHVRSNAYLAPIGADHAEYIAQLESEVREEQEKLNAFDQA